MDLTISVDDDYLANVLASGLAGGINHWCKSVKAVHGPESDAAHKKSVLGLSRTCFAPLFDGYWLVKTTDDKTTYRMDRAKIERAVRLIATLYPHHLGDVLGDQADAITGNVLIQCAALGDLIYE